VKQHQWTGNPQNKNDLKAFLFWEFPVVCIRVPSVAYFLVQKAQTVSSDWLPGNQSNCLVVSYGIMDPTAFIDLFLSYDGRHLPLSARTRIKGEEICT
jgi:hypothetical protein